MREIKFRTWDKKYHMLEYDDSPDLLIGMDGKVYQKEERNYAGTSFIEYEVANRFELMQYTGLKDKNGKEIYEGDVLDLSLEDDSVLRCEIVYQAPSFCRKWHHANTIRLRQREIEPMAWNTYILYEVIGNIYENPELLEESK